MASLDEVIDNCCDDDSENSCDGDLDCQPEGDYEDSEIQDQRRGQAEGLSVVQPTEKRDSGDQLSNKTAQHDSRQKQEQQRPIIFSNTSCHV